MSIRLKPEHLPEDVSFEEKSGFYAEKDENGHISHFGYYQDGEPVGWTLKLEANNLTATKIETVVSPNPHDPEDELTEDEALGWIHRIAGLQGGSLICSFCGKSNTEVAKLIAGPECYICNECVGLCTDIMSEEDA